jgi:hypothetical protein
MPHKYGTSRQIARELINMKAKLEHAVVDEDNDIVRTHLNNALGVIVGLEEALKLEKSWKRPAHA